MGKFVQVNNVISYVHAYRFDPQPTVLGFDCTKEIRLPIYTWQVKIGPALSLLGTLDFGQIIKTVMQAIPKNQNQQEFLHHNKAWL